MRLTVEIDDDVLNEFKSRADEQGRLYKFVLERLMVKWLEGKVKL